MKASMLDFLLTATDPDGKRDVHCVKANDSQEAYRQLESRGFTDIVLHTDDTAAAAIPLTMLDKGRMSPRDLAEIASRSLAGAHWYLLKKQVRRWWCLGLLLTILCVIWPNPYLLMAIISLVLGWVTAQLFVLFSILLNPRSDAVSQRESLQDAYCWGRWDEVLHREKKLRGVLSDFELDGYKAGALAGLGFVDEGLDILQQWEGSEDIQRWGYLLSLSAFYRGAGMFEEARKFSAAALTEHPQDPTLIIHHAISLSRDELDTELVGELIQSAEQIHLTERASLSFHLAKGMWLSNCGNGQAAIAEFEKLKNLHKNCAIRDPEISLLMDMTQAYLAVALLQIGDRERAAQEAKPALPRLRALNRTKLLEKLADITD